jgi:hypothetical protein
MNKGKQTLMKMDMYLQKTSNVFAENRLLKLVVVVISMVAVYNSFLLKKALNTHRTILVSLPLSTHRVMPKDGLKSCSHSTLLTVMLKQKKCFMTL